MRSLVGRAREVDALAAAVEGAAAGHGSTVVLVGEPGIGKSRLLREAATLGGALTVTGRCTSVDIPLRPFEDAFLGLARTGVRPADAPDLAEYRAALGRILPEWRSEVAPGSLLVLGEAVLRYVTYAAQGRPAVLGIEDVHWADPETLAALEYMADHTSSTNVVLVLTMRPDPGPASDLLRSLRERRAATIVELCPLEPAEVVQLASEYLGVRQIPGPLADVLMDRTRGVPFLAEELLSAAVAGGTLVPDGATVAVGGDVAALVPTSVVASVAARASAVGDDAALVVLQAGAVIGHSFDGEGAAAVAAVDDQLAAGVLQRAVDLQLLDRDGPATFAFRHALTRDAVLSEMAAGDRRRLATKAIEELADAPLDRRARWAEDSGDARLAATLLTSLARENLDHGAVSTAEGVARRAAAAIEGRDDHVLCDALDVLLDALAQSGKTAEAGAEGARLLGALLRIDAPGHRVADAHTRLARAAATAGNRAAAAGHLGAARAATEEGDALRRASADVIEAELALADGDFEAVARLARAALTVAERERRWTLVCEAIEILAQVLRLRDPGEAAALLERMLAIADAYDLRLWRARALRELGIVDMVTVGGAARADRARDEALAIGAVAVAVEVELTMAWLLALQFRLPESLVAARGAVELSERYELGALPLALAVTAGCHGWLTDGAALEATLVKLQEVEPDDPEVWSIAWGDGRGTFALFSENRKEALRCYDRAMGYALRFESAEAPFRGMWALLHTVEDLEGVSARNAARPSDGSGPWYIEALVGFADAIAAGRAGDARRAVTAVAEAQERVAEQVRGDWVRHLGRRYAAEAALRDGWGDPVGWLREAEAFFDSAGLTRVVSACRSLLHRTGQPVSRRGRGSATVPPRLKALGITSREMDVLELVAQGLGNREIGERLYLSHRTIEKHVESLLQKTGTANRTQLAVLVR
ncbi:MAG TPA: AAA family ATPase [Acidimicrobiales bacterium]|nr:AAA family ATPase [Acidimicrobiales bacterium]